MPWARPVKSPSIIRLPCWWHPVVANIPGCQLHLSSNHHPPPPSCPPICVSHRRPRPPKTPPEHPTHRCLLVQRGPLVVPRPVALPEQPDQMLGSRFRPFTPWTRTQTPVCETAAIMLSKTIASSLNLTTTTPLCLSCLSCPTRLPITTFPLPTPMLIMPLPP